VVNRGELLVDRGNLRGSCVVILVVEEHANFSKYIFRSSEEGTRLSTALHRVDGFFPLRR
jgi:hypothetical protein